MTSSASAEPKGSEPSSTECQHPDPYCYASSGSSEEWTRYYLCTTCKAKWETVEKRVAPDEPRCHGCGHTEGEGCGCPPHGYVSKEHCDRCAEPWKVQLAGGPLIPRPEDPEPPMTPEEEEQAPEDERQCLVHPFGKERPCPPSCGCCKVQANEPPPPQPERRPPYRVGYSVLGHIYEVALAGDASVFAVDGDLVIKHNLGPVAGICYVRPMEGEGA